MLKLTGLRYAAVAFGLPCTIDDSDVDVPEIADPLTTAEITYHRLKCQLYRIMGPFLGRKRQSSQLRSLPAIHAELEAWYAAIPSSLRYGSTGHRDASQSILTQMQAIALQLRYDNLQIVLHRHAVFPQTRAAAPQADRSLSLQQLFESATRTARAPNFPATDRICRSSHAAMHVGMCSFSTGVVLCALLGMSDNMLSGSQSADAVASLDGIIALLVGFPGGTIVRAAERADSAGTSSDGAVPGDW